MSVNRNGLVHSGFGRCFYLRHRGRGLVLVDRALAGPGGHPLRWRVILQEGPKPPNQGCLGNPGITMEHVGEMV